MSITVFVFSQNSTHGKALIKLGRETLLGHPIFMTA